MTSPSLPTRLEAILYLKGRPVSIGELAELADSDQSVILQQVTNGIVVRMAILHLCSCANHKQPVELPA